MDNQEQGQNQPNGESNGGSAGAGYIALFLFLCLTGWYVYILFGNIVSLSVINNFGWGVYFNNVSHFHVDTYVKHQEWWSAKRFVFGSIPRNLFEKENGTNAVHKIKKDETLIVLFKGYVYENNEIWCAVETFKKNKLVRGWINGIESSDDCKNGEWNLPFNDSYKKYKDYYEFMQLDDPKGYY